MLIVRLEDSVHRKKLEDLLLLSILGVIERVIKTELFTKLKFESNSPCPVPNTISHLCPTDSLFCHRMVTLKGCKIFWPVHQGTW